MLGLGVGREGLQVLRLGHLVAGDGSHGRALNGGVVGEEEEGLSQGVLA